MNIRRTTHPTRRRIPAAPGSSHTLDPRPRSLTATAMLTAPTAMHMIVEKSSA